MLTETPVFELNRLRMELSKIRQDEVFGGLSPAEQAEYNRKAERIHELMGTSHVSTTSEKSAWAAKAE